MLTLGEQFPQQPNEHMLRGTEIHKQVEDFINGIGEKPYFKNFEASLDDLVLQKAKAELAWGLNEDWTPCPDFKQAWGKCIIDAFVHTPDYLLIIDFKTGKPSPLSHLDQAQTYAIAGHCYYPEIPEIHTQFWYLDKGSVTHHTFEKQHTNKYKLILQARIDRMHNDTERKPKPNKWSCKYCSYNQHCDYAAEC
jgi:CRISPR/Cas system-associated exonuclease Cas4 (RecB family)